jgi:hypothetical protein
MTTPPPTGRAVARVLRSSLKAASRSLELLTTSQLLAMETDLRKTLTVVRDEIHARETGTPGTNVPKS